MNLIENASQKYLKLKWSVIEFIHGMQAVMKKIKKNKSSIFTEG